MKKLFYLDKLRGLAIIFVVVQHITSPNIKMVSIGNPVWWISDFFLSFSTPAVPIFIMISGALLLSQKNDSSLFQFFSKRVKKVVIPFIAWIFIYYFFNLYVMHDYFQPYEFIKEVIKGSNTKHLPQHLWFMPLIISLYLVTPILKKFIENATLEEKRYFLVMSIFFGVIIPMVQNFTDIIIPYQGYIFSALYFFIGYFMISLSDDWVNRKNLFLSIFVAGFIFSFLGTYYLSISSGKYDGYWFSAQSPGIFLISISIFMLFKRFFSQAPKTLFGKLFSYLGKMSYDIYFIHQFWIYILVNGLIRGYRISSFFPLPHFVEYILINTLMILFFSIISIYIIRVVPFGKLIIPE